MARPDAAQRLTTLEVRLPVKTLAPARTLGETLAHISDPEARELVALACVVLMDPTSTGEERWLAARWCHETSERGDWIVVAGLQGHVDYTLPWPDFWPPEHKVTHTVQDYCAEMQARPGL